MTTLDVQDQRVQMASLPTRSNSALFPLVLQLLYFLSTQAFEKMEREDPLLAASFHRFIVISLAERLNHREKELRSLLQ